jgi:mannobiose 2-epimerase
VWVSAEAAVGYLNAYQLSKNHTYLERCLAVWHFIGRYLIDKEYGEWIWGVDRDLVRVAAPKVSMWKCPYHTARACMEIMRRCTSILHDE